MTKGFSMKLLVLVLALAAVAAAQQSDDRVDADGHLKSEHQIPAGDYCKRVGVPITARETHAHACDCKYSCSVDADGNVSETDGEKHPTCKSYCSKDGRRCTCHVEEPCDMRGNALADMNGAVVAVRVR